MRIAVVGAGGVGGLLAAELSRAGAHEVVLVARGAALAAVRADGLRLETPEGVTSARPALVVAEPGQAGPCDVTLVAVKAWQVPALAPSLAPLLAGGGVVVPLQNGVEAAGRLAAALPPAQVAGGVVWVYAWAERPGVIRRNGLAPRVVCGPRPGAPVGPALEALAVALRHAGVRATRSGASATPLARPTAATSSISPRSSARASGVARMAPAGARATAPTRPRVPMSSAFSQVVADAAASARTLAFVDGVPAGSTASMQRDLGAGRPSELDDQAGAILRAARAAGVAAPLHQALLAALLPQERAARGEAPAFDRT